MPWDSTQVDDIGLMVFLFFSMRNVNIWWKESVKGFGKRIQKTTLKCWMFWTFSFLLTSRTQKKTYIDRKKNRPSLSWNLNPVVSYDSFTGLSLSKCGLIWLPNSYPDIRVYPKTRIEQTSWEKPYIYIYINCILNYISLSVVFFFWVIYIKKEYNWAAVKIVKYSPINFGI